MQLWRLSHLFGFLVACGLLFSVAHADNAKANTTTLGAGWDKAVAKSMTYASYAAYCSGSSIQAWNCYWCKKDVFYSPKLQIVGYSFDNRSDTFGYVGTWNSQIIIVAFRGTVMKNIKNWMVNIQTVPVPYPPVKNALVHPGFYGAYLQHAARIKALVNLAQHSCASCTEAYFTGHSLGAALATLAAVDIYQSPRAVPLTRLSVYSLGGPRIGDVGFANYINSKLNVYRFIQEHDPVPRVPPMLLKYQHAPQELWIRDNSIKQCSPTNGEDPTCLKGTSDGRCLGMRWYPPSVTPSPVSTPTVLNDTPPKDKLLPSLHIIGYQATGAINRGLTGGNSNFVSLMFNNPASLAFAKIATDKAAPM